MANYAFGIHPIPDVENGHEFIGDNFHQLLPHTAILTGKTGLKFKNCNLTNCDIPADSVCEGCKPWHCSHCSNVNPKLINHGLTACVQNCEHVIGTDSVTIDGVVVDTIYYYDHKAVE